MARYSHRQIQRMQDKNTISSASPKITNACGTFYTGWAEGVFVIVKQGFAAHQLVRGEDQTEAIAALDDADKLQALWERLNAERIK